MQKRRGRFSVSEDESEEERLTERGREFQFTGPINTDVSDDTLALAVSATKSITKQRLQRSRRHRPGETNTAYILRCGVN